MYKPSAHRIYYIVVILGCLVMAGALLHGLLSLERGYIPPVAWDTPLKLLYRIAFWFCFPVSVMLSRLFAGSRGLVHHWIGWITPFAYAGFWGIYEIARRWGHLRIILHRKQEKNEPGLVKEQITDNADLITRRELIGKAVAGTIAVGVASVAGYGALLEPQMLRLRRYRIPITGLPTDFDGFRILQISDTHYGMYVPYHYLTSMVQRVNALSPDLIVLTGDYVLRAGNAHALAVAPFKALKSKYGILGVLGNHDHWEDAALCRKAIKDIGIPLIDNDRMFLRVGHGLQREAPGLNEGLCIAGLGDLWTDSLIPQRAFRDVPETMPRVVLSHNPDSAEKIDTQWRIDLMLSGHTHGGQVSFPVIGAPIVPSDYGQRYTGGLCQSPIGPVIVSCGVGMAYFPVRLNVPPEIVEITLVGTSGNTVAKNG